jgi:plasmid stability protein
LDVGRWVVSSLLIRHVDDALRSQLKARARVHRRSLEEEARKTLRTATARDASVAPKADIVDLFTRRFGPKKGVEQDLPPRSAEPDRKPPDLSGPDDDR